MGVESVAVPMTQTAAVRMQLDHAQRLRARHADAERGFVHRRVDAAQAGDRIAQDRKQAVERERKHRGQEAERGKSEPQRALGQGREPEQQRIEQRQQRQSGNRLHDAGQRQHQPAQRRPAHRDQRQRQAYGEPERKRGHAHQHMAAEIVGQPRQRLVDARIDPHAHCGVPRFISAPSRSACRRGVCISSLTYGSCSSVISACGVPSAITRPARITMIRSASSTASSVS